MKLQTLKRYYEVVTSAIYSQMVFVDNLEVSLGEQSRMKEDIAKKLVALDPACAEMIVANERSNKNNCSNSTSAHSANLFSFNQSHRVGNECEGAPSVATTTNQHQANELQPQNHSSPSNSGHVVASSNALLLVSEMHNLKNVHSVLHKRKEIQMAPFMFSTGGFPLQAI